MYSFPAAFRLRDELARGGGFDGDGGGGAAPPLRPVTQLLDPLTH